MKLFKSIITLTFLLPVFLNAQTVLLDDPGFNFEAISGPDPLYEWDSPEVDISNCTSIEIVYDFEWSQSWPGGGNMESSDECGACAGDPEDPFAGDCDNCWDMLYTQIFFDGNEIANELQGGPGFDQQSGTATLGPFCTDGSEELNLEFDATVHAASSPPEGIEVTDIMVICWEATPMLEEPVDVCAGGTINLTGDAEDTDAVASWLWETTGSSLIDDDAAQNTFANGVSDGEEFTLTTTDLNGCQGTASFEVTASDFEVTLDGGGIVCENDCSDEDSDLIIEISGGNPLYQISLNINGITLPFVPSIDVEGILRICSDSDIFLPDYDDNTDPPQLIIPTALFPIDIDLISIVDADGCTGTINGGAVSFDLANPPDINEAESPEYCVTEDGTIDLTVMDDVIDTDGFDVIWFEDEDLEDQIGNPANYDPSDGLTVWAVVDNGECLSSAVEIELDVLFQPIIDVLVSSINGCSDDVFFLPDIEEVVDVTNEINPNYYLDENGMEGPIFQIDPQTVDEIYVYDAASPDCFDQVIIPVNISGEADIESPLEALVSCGEIVLPEPEGSDIASYEYNLEEDGSGDSYFEGDIIREEDNINLLYLIVISDEGCETIVELEISITSSVNYTADIESPVCADSIQLPAIMPPSVSVSYYTASMGMGAALMPGDVIYAPFDGQLFIFDSELDSNCASEDTIQLLISQGPMPEFPSDTMACEFLVLPEFQGITGPNIRYAQFPITDPNSTYLPGDTLSFSQRLYVLDTIGNCTFFDSLEVTIAVEPFAGTDNSLIVCDNFDVETLDLMQLVSNADEGGQWTYPDVPDFNPTDSTNVLLDVLPVGTYNFQYVIEDSLCGLFSSSIEIEIIPSPFGGENNSISLCQTSSLLNFMELISSPDERGMWQQVSGPEQIMLTDSTQVDMSTVTPGSYAFIYVIQGQPIADFCEPETSSLFIDVGVGANAGQDNNLTACQGDILELTDFISTEAETDGFFEGDNIIFSGTSWNTAASPAGIDYTIDYIVPSDDPACENDTATIVVTLVEQLNAGTAIAGPPVCEETSTDLSQYIDNQSATGTFSLVSNPAQTISDGMWTADQTTQFYHILEAVGACPADTLEFEVEVIETPVFNVSILGSQLCSAESNTIDLGISHLSAESLVYFVNIIANETGETVLSIDSLTQNNLSFFISAQRNEETFQNDTLFVNRVPGTYTIEIRAFDSTLNCGDDLDISSVFEINEAYVEDIEVDLCPGDTYEYNGQIINSSQTLFLTDNSGGCDSIINITINNYPQLNGLIEGTFCEGDTLEILGEVYFENTTTTEIFENQAAFGCDSIVDIDIIFESAVFTNINDTLCEGEFLDINGQTYDINNPEGMDTLLSAALCDSIINIDLTFLNTPMADIEMRICEDEILTVGNDTYDLNNQEGTTVLEGMAVNGCDSIVNVQLELLPDATARLEMGICPGEIVSVGTDNYGESMLTGSTVLEDMALNGCDSIVNVELFLLDNVETLLMQDVCPGQSISVGPDTYGDMNLSGSTVLANASANGCDSIVNVELNLLIPEAEITAPLICPEDTIGVLSILTVENMTGPFNISISNTASGSYDSFPLDFELAPGTYNVLITDQNGCNYEETLSLDNISGLDLMINEEEVSDNTYQLSFNANFNYSVLNWSSTSGMLSCEDCDNPLIEITEETELVLELLSEESCTITESIILEYQAVVNDPKIYIPNIFDINSAGNNNFTIFTDGTVKLQQLQIFDRWGNLMFTTDRQTGLDFSWDGRYNDALVEQGVYVYKLLYTDSQSVEKVIIGDITLLR